MKQSANPTKIPQSDGDGGKHSWTAQAIENSNISVSSKGSASPGLDMGYAEKKVQRYRWSAQVQEVTECPRGSTYPQGELLWIFVPKVIRLVLSLILIHSWKSWQLDFVLAYPQADVNGTIHMKLHKGFELNGRQPWRHTCCSYWRKFMSLN